MCGFQGSAFSDFYVHSPNVAKGFGLTTVAKSGNEVGRWARVNNYLHEFGFSAHVSKGFGFTQEKNGVEYIRWRTVNHYLRGFGFSPLVGKDDFLRGGILRRNGIMRLVVTRGRRMDKEAVKDFLRDTREKRLAIAAAKERMERTGQDVKTIKSVRMDTKVQTNHQFDLAEFVERLEEAKLAYLKSYEAWITRAGVVYRILDAAGCHAELWVTISRRYLWARPWNEVAKAVGVSRRMANTYERRAIERIAASEAAGEIITRGRAALHDLVSIPRATS